VYKLAGRDQNGRYPAEAAARHYECLPILKESKAHPHWLSEVGLSESSYLATASQS
jgi:hypothetical protein